jgi:prophage regulatory protein
MTQQILKISDIVKSSKLSKSSIYRLAAQGKFPTIFKLGVRSSGVLQSDYEKWLQERVEASRNGSEA